MTNKWTNKPASTMSADDSDMKELVRMTQKQQYSGSDIMFSMYFMYLP